MTEERDGLFYAPSFRIVFSRRRRAFDARVGVSLSTTGGKATVQIGKAFFPKSN